MPAFTLPEMLRVPLDEMVLAIRVLDLGDVRVRAVIVPSLQLNDTGLVGTKPLAGVLRCCSEPTRSPGSEQFIGNAA